MPLRNHPRSVRRVVKLSQACRAEMRRGAYLEDGYLLWEEMRKT